LREALAECAGAEEAFICGGGEIFAEALPLADRIYLTLVHKDSEGDTYFPEVPDGFTETEREEVGGELPHSFVTYERRR
jgi:dihydrofolate reductase